MRTRNIQCTLYQYYIRVRVPVVFHFQSVKAINRYIIEVISIWGAALQILPLTACAAIVLSLKRLQVTCNTCKYLTILKKWIVL